MITRASVQVISAHGLLSTDGFWSASDPYCVVKAGLYDGTETVIGTTAVKDNTLTPVWEETFEHEAEDRENPVMYLVFTIYDCDADEVDGTVKPNPAIDDFLGEVFFHVSRQPELEASTKYELELDVGTAKLALAEAEAGREPRNMAEYLSRKVTLAKKTLVPGVVEHGSLLAYKYSKRQLRSLAQRSAKRMKNGIRHARIAGEVAQNILASMLPSYGAQTDIADDDSKSDEDLAKAMLARSRESIQRRQQRLSVRSDTAGSLPGSVGGSRRGSTSSSALAKLGLAKINIFGSKGLETSPEDLFQAMITDANMLERNKYSSGLKIAVEIEGCTEKVPNFELLEQRTDIRWRSKPNVIREVKPYVAVICGEVVSARELLDLDVWGKSDPYCEVVVQFQDSTLRVIHRTRVIHDTLNPIWRERFHFVAEVGESKPKLSKINFNLYDSDNDAEFGSADDFLGSAKIWLKDVDTLHGMQEEEIQLGGLRRKPKVDASSGRRVVEGKVESTVTVSIFVEWRLEALKPVYIPTVKKKWKPRERNRNARADDVDPPEGHDPTSTEAVSADAANLAPGVWDRYSNYRLTDKMTRATDWETVPAQTAYALKPAIRDAPGTEVVWLPGRPPPPEDPLLPKIPVPEALVSKTLPGEIRDWQP